MSEEKIKIILADDHPVFREGICSTINSLPFISDIRQASNGQEVIKFLESDLADVVMLDIKMEPMNGFEAAGVIRNRFPSVKVIALSMFSEEKYIMQLIQLGVVGYLIKNAGKEELIEALRSVMKGQHYFTKNVSRVLYTKLGELISDAEKNSASPRHMEKLEEIIYLMYLEKNTAEIAELLFLSKRTIEEYRLEIMKMTNSKTAAGVAKYAIEHGIPDDLLIKSRINKLLKKVDD
jgi:DNA-binding NarL/FixJ family response regulator